jgi:hypothetical protein
MLPAFSARCFVTHVASAPSLRAASPATLENLALHLVGAFP